MSKTQATLCSLNVGTPRTVEWGGRTFATGIFKFPVGSRLAVEGVNVLGDDQADREAHGGPDRAVYAYAREDYDWWSQELGVELEPGRFGENLTTAGIDVSDARVGERWRIGTAVFEVSQPRIPCYKLSMRMNDAGFLKRFSTALKPGAYLRILQAGEIGSGDRIEIDYRPYHALSMREFAKIYFFEHTRINELLAAPQLSDPWKQWAAERLAKGR